MTTEVYYLWMVLAFGEGEPEINRLLSDYGTPERAYDAFRDNTALVGPQLSERAGSVTLEDADRTWLQLMEKNINMVDIESPVYPKQLKKTPNPPVMLFTLGDEGLLRRKKLLTVVGSRALTGYTENALCDILDEISPTLPIVSTLSVGSDQYTCMKCINQQRPFIEIMPCGLEMEYPKGSSSIRDYLIHNGGLCVSEFLPKVKPGHVQFHRRSRILGGISQVTLVTQAGAESGALLTAEYSAQPLYMIPCAVKENLYAGQKKAISDGGMICLNGNSIRQAFWLCELREAGFDPDKSKERRENRERLRLLLLEGQNEAESTDNGTDDAARRGSIAAASSAAAPPADAEEHAAEDGAPLPEGAVDETADAVSYEPPDEAAEEEQGAAAPAAALPPDIALPPEQYEVYAIIEEAGTPVSANDIIQKTEIDPGILPMVLLDLEMDGHIRTVGNKYTTAKE